MEEQEIIKEENINTQEKPKKVLKPRKVKEKKTSNITPVIAILCLLIGAVGMYLLMYYVLPFDNSSTIINKSEKEVTVTDAGIADAVEKLYDAVTVVEVYVNDKMYASGTGFVYKTDDKKAYILTNHHVVSATGKVTVKVMFTNGTESEVKIEGSDKYSDLAVLSVDAKDIISVAQIGSTDKMRLGDTVFTIGAPLDTEYYWTVTRGILSGKDRMVEVSLDNTSTSDFVMKVLQTDASINSGNSGGPIANANGEVIGITNMKLVSSGVEGIGFAIPIEDAVDYAESIIAGKTIERPLLGVEMADLSSTEAKWYLFQQGFSLNTELTTGAVITKVQSGSPADQAGLKRGDIITKFDGINIKSIATLKYYLYKHSIGDKVEIEYERNGQTETTSVKLTVASE